MKILLIRTSAGRAYCTVEANGKAEYTSEVKGRVRVHSSRNAAVAAVTAAGGVYDTKHGMDIIPAGHGRTVNRPVRV